MFDEQTDNPGALNKNWNTILEFQLIITVLNVKLGWIRGDGLCSQAIFLTWVQSNFVTLVHAARKKSS